MAEATDLFLLSLEEADGDEGEDHSSETLDPAPFRPSASVVRCAADLLAPGLSDLPHPCPSSRRRIPASILESGHGSDHGSEFLEDQVVSPALDLFDQCPLHPQYQVDPSPEPPESPHFSVLEMADEMSPDDLGLGLALGVGSRPVFEIQEGGDDGDQVVVSDWGADEFFLGRRSCASESIEFSRACPVDDDGLRIVGFESDSDSDEQIVAIGADSDSVGGAPDQATEDTGLPLCWDCLHVEDDRRDPNEEFEWEEVGEADGRLEEQEALSMMVVVDEEGATVLTELPLEFEEDAARNVEWEVLFTLNNLERNPMDPEDAESYFEDDHEGLVVVGQFQGHDSSLKGTLPAAKLVVENLPSAVLTEEDIANNNTTCVVCKDEIPIEEWVKKLPCSHHYHEECILPWLGIRNTCPLCRFELPTDDPEYEKWKAQRAGNEEAQFRYDFEILPEV